MAQHSPMSTVNTCPSIIGQPSVMTTSASMAGPKSDNKATIISSVALSDHNNFNQSNSQLATNGANSPQYPANNSITNTINNVIAKLANPNASKSNVGGEQSLDGAKQLLTKPRLLELVGEVDASIQLDDDVEEMLISMADSFVNTIAEGACKIAKHRHQSSIDVRDVQLYLEQAYNMWIPGLGTDELKPYKRAATTEAHKQRVSLIKKFKK